jgi:2-polyprenyl-3-methyl-5-hydroxy-6-metoxy-1,4-benzoquinol methylase
MVANQGYYEKQHSQDAGYGKSVFNLRRLTSSRGFEAWLQRQQQRPIRMLDVGCGKGQFLLDLTRHFARQGREVERVVGLDLVRCSPNVYDQISPKLEFHQQSVDGVALPFPDNSFDFVSCNHVLEHIFQTEALVREFHRVMDKRGLCVISVPNIAAWMNRIAFLFGGQPLGSEVGVETTAYGFWPGFLKGRLKRFVPSGHIRDFTPGSLRDLTSACGFRPLGFWAQNGGFICGLNPRLDRNLGILLESTRRPA